jgi:hypothetical protein
MNPVIVRRIANCVTVFVAITILSQRARAQIDPDHLIVTINEFTGGVEAQKNIGEYTTSGNRVQILSGIPAPGGSSLPPEQARDLVLGIDNAIYLYNGTSDPYLARYDLSTRTWSETTFGGWSTYNTSYDGGLGVLGQYIYATDSMTPGPGDLPHGIVRFDISGGLPVRFAETIDPVDLTIGPDRVLYAIERNSPLVFRFDPITFATLGSLQLAGGDNRGIAVATDGSIFIAESSYLGRYSASGTLLGSLTVPNVSFTDIDISPSGQIALGTGFSGEVIVTDLDLDSFVKFRVTDSPLGGTTFVAWAVPEPSTFTLLAIGAAGLTSSLFRKRCRPTGNRKLWLERS